MSAHTRKQKRDIEKNYPAKQFVIKLKRLVDCIEKGTPFRIQIAGERVFLPLPLSISNMSAALRRKRWNFS